MLYGKRRNSSNGNIKNHRFVLFFSESILYKVFILKRFWIVLCAKDIVEYIVVLVQYIFDFFLFGIYIWKQISNKYKKRIWLNIFFTYLYRIMKQLQASEYIKISLMHWKLLPHEFFSSSSFVNSVSHVCNFL